MKKKKRKPIVKASTSYLDKNITRVLAPHIPSCKNFLTMPNGIFFIKTINSSLTADDKIFINFFIMERVRELKLGIITKENFSRLANTLYMAFRLTCYFLDKKLCKEESALNELHHLGIKSYKAMSSLLTCTSERYAKSKQLIVTGDNIVCIEKAAQVLDSVMDITTVGEWYSVWHMVALEMMKLSRTKYQLRQAA